MCCNFSFSLFSAFTCLRGIQTHLGFPNSFFRSHIFQNIYRPFLSLAIQEQVDDFTKSTMISRD
ncbi:hypothetical protein HanPI659440_Chr09g0353431 [Helianthus annuus]|nr:hypothetical protein HanPI659440_Chr09g0353431 [Helianthus annuus]